MDRLHLGDFDSSQEAKFHFRFFTSMSRRPVFSETRDLRVSLALIKVIQEDVLRALGMLIESSWPSLARTLRKTMWFFAKMPKINNFLVNMHLRGRWKSLLALLAIWKFHTVYYTGWIVGNNSPIGSKMTLWVSRPLNNDHWKIDYVVKFTKSGQTRLRGVPPTWNFACERNFCLRNRKTEGRGVLINIWRYEVTKPWCTRGTTFSGQKSQKCQFLSFG